jgi:hypothetical protein
VQFSIQLSQEFAAYQRKWDEELESFKKLVGRLQAAAQEAGTTQPGTPALFSCVVSISRTPYVGVLWLTMYAVGLRMSSCSCSAAISAAVAQWGATCMHLQSCGLATCQDPPPCC